MFYRGSRIQKTAVEQRVLVGELRRLPRLASMSLMDWRRVASLGLVIGSLRKVP